MWKDGHCHSATELWSMEHMVLFQRLEEIQALEGYQLDDDDKRVAAKVVSTVVFSLL